MWVTCRHQVVNVFASLQCRRWMASVEANLEKSRFAEKQLRQTNRTTSSHLRASGVFIMQPHGATDHRTDSNAPRAPLLLRFARHAPLFHSALPPKQPPAASREAPASCSASNAPLSGSNQPPWRIRKRRSCPCMLLPLRPSKHIAPARTRHSDRRSSCQVGAAASPKID